MNKKEIIKNLRIDIQDIYTLINRFENPEHIHPIDIDVALSKVRNLYELLLKLNSDQTYTTDNQKEEILTKTEQFKEEPDKHSEKEVIKDDKQEINKPKETKTEIIQEPEFIIEEKSEKKEESKSQEDEIIQPEKKEIISKQNDKSPEIVADKFQSKKFVHDNIAQKSSKKDVSTKLQTKPIKDINSAIGLNDKFIFIRELFNNDKDHYIETIQILNNFDTFENAISFLNENFDWDSEDANYERLKELVRRKYL